jgi:uncharacterized membrane protein YhaH (DUF805 family)
VYGSLDYPPIVLQANRWSPAQFQRLGISLLVLALLAYDIFGFSKPNLFTAIPLGLLAIVLVVARLWYIIVPGRLVIAPDGLTLRRAWRTQRWTWDAIQDFRPISVARMQSVGFDFVDKTKRSVVRQTNVNLAGVEGALPGGFDMDPSELAGLLNRARERWANLKAAPLSPNRIRTFWGRALSYYYVLLVGRMSSRALWISLVVVAIVSVIIAFAYRSGWAGPPLTLMACLVLCRARCRDIGWPGWLGFLLIPIVLLGAVAQAVFSQAELLASLGSSSMALAATAALGFIKGDPNPNRYGAPPSGVAEPIDQVFS